MRALPEPTEETFGTDAHYEGNPPEILSAKLLSPPGPSSILTTTRQWQWMKKDMDSTLDLFRQMRDSLQQTWSGESATQAIAAAVRFEQWLENLCAKLGETYRQARAICLAYDDARNKIVPLDVLADNCTKREQLAKLNGVGLYTPELENLKYEYSVFAARDILVMAIYDKRVGEAFAAMPEWAEAPPITKAG